MVDQSATVNATGANAIDLGPRSHLDAILAALGAVGGREIIDVGCGEGQTSRDLAAAGARVSAFDPFIDASDWVAHGSGSFRLVRASADALPVDDRSADAVLFIFSLHHVPQPKLVAALAEARRRLCL